MPTEPLTRVPTPDEIEAICQQIINACHAHVECLRGNRGGMPFLVGEVMSITLGQARPEDVQATITRLLGLV